MDVSLKKLDTNYEEDLSKDLEKSCKVSKESLDKKEEIITEISLKCIEKFNDKLSDDGYCNIKEYKENFLKHFDKNLQEYYNDFEEYFSDYSSDSKSNENSNLSITQNLYKTSNTLKTEKNLKEEYMSNTQENENKLIKGQQCSIE